MKDGLDTRPLLLGQPARANALGDGRHIRAGNRFPIAKGIPQRAEAPLSIQIRGVLGQYGLDQLLQRLIARIPGPWAVIVRKPGEDFLRVVQSVCLREIRVPLL